MTEKQIELANAAGFWVPNDLISALPSISDLVELKLLLYFYSRGKPPIDPATAITWTALVRDHQWSRNFTAEQLTSGLETAVSHDLLSVEYKGNEKAYYLNVGKLAVKNNETNRQDSTDNGIGALFSRYEQNIGPITPIIADAITYAGGEYPAAWIDEAISIAVKMNKRSWKYIEAILKRWKEEGHGTIQDRRDPEKNGSAGRPRSILEEFFDGE